jgi:hypothetical protein
LIQHASNLLIKHGILEEEIRVDDSVLPQLRDEIRRRQIVDKLVVLANVSYEHAMKLVQDCTYIIGGTGRVKNVINTDGKHILSPRLTDGGLSITDFGAEALYDQRLLSVPKQSTDFNPHFGVGEGIPLVVVEKDAIEFVLKGTQCVPRVHSGLRFMAQSRANMSHCRRRRNTNWTWSFTM